MTWSLTEIEAALQQSWSAQTCDPADVHRWHPGNRARGQCGASAFVVQDLLGGDLVLADVVLADGSTDGLHYWNRLPDGADVDLTRQQFHDGEQLTGAQVVSRIPGPPSPRCVDQYLTLLQAVLSRLSTTSVYVDVTATAPDRDVAVTH